MYTYKPACDIIVIPVSDDYLTATVLRQIIVFTTHKIWMLFTG